MQSLITMPAKRTGKIMATLTIRKVDTKLKEQLRVRAARNGHSMEAELRQILRDALSAARGREQEPNLAEAIRGRFLGLGGVDDLEPHPAVPVVAPALDR